MAAESKSSPDDLRAAFEAIAMPFTRPLYHTAHRLTRRPEDARDLVQETYLRAYRTFASFEPGTNCRGWLFTVMYSIFINKYHQAAREPEPISLEQLDERFHGTTPAYAAALDDVWQRGTHLPSAAAEVDNALAQLPEMFRSAILFVDVEELSYEEAASVLQCPVGTVRSRLFRARKMLFLALRPYAERAGYLKRPTRLE